MKPTGTNGPTDPTQPPPLGQSGPRGKVKTTRVRYAIPESHTRPSGGGMIGPGTRGGGHSGRDTPGLFPFRTRKLRLPAPMVLHPPGCGRVGHRRLHTTKGGPATGPPFLAHTAGHTHGHTGHREPHTRTATHGHSATHARPHAPQKPHTPTRTGPHGHSATHANTRQSSPHRTGSLSIGFGLGLSCGRMVLNVVGLASVC